MNTSCFISLARVLAVAFLIHTPVSPRAATVEVRIQNFAFNPSTVTVNVGDTVTWRQMDDIGHTTTSASGSAEQWSSPLLGQGQTFSHLFDTAGNFSYFCVPHPDMRGTVRVQGVVSQPPTVSISSPANNATFTSGTAIEITANASVSGSTISSVEFFNGGTSLGADNTAPYSTSQTLPVGTHVLTARATAANGQSATSSSVTVTVTGQAATPTVAISSPANNATLSSGTVTITASASVRGGTVTMVEFFEDGNFLGMVHGEPFTVTATLPTGTHSLTAKATTSAGATAVSDPVIITIQPTTPGRTPVENPFPPMATTDTTIELQTFAEGMVAPLGLAEPDDGSGRLFVFDQIGIIHLIVNGARSETPFFDMRDQLVRLSPNYDERGLLGLALHPNFAQNGLIYTYASEPTDGVADFPIDPGDRTNNHQTVLVEWKVDAANSNRVDAASRREILRIDQPQSNHNGGVMHFGADGMLYLALGDGGNRDDEGLGHSVGGNGQDLSKILGKIIRIDVNGRTSANQQYAVPTDNPFVAIEGLDEIYAYGFRNPYSWSFDKLTSEMYVADVGQGAIEELDRVFKGGNYGWPIKEGTFYFEPAGTNSGFITLTPPAGNVPANLVDPIAEYDHSEGLSIIGGYMYHGTQLPNLIGRYITADFGRFDAPVGRLFVLDRSEFRELRIGADNRTFDHWIKGFGQDQQGELYVFASTNLGPTGTSGKMLKIVPSQHNPEISSVAKNGTNLTVNWTGGVGPFVVESKATLNDRAWRVVGAMTNGAAQIPVQGAAEFLRIVDSAGIRDGAFTAFLSAAAERPTAVTNSIGTGMGTLNLEGNTLHFDIHYSGLSAPAIAAHIHGPAAASEARGILIDLASFNGGGFSTSGVISGSVTLSPEHKAHILAGKTYVNIHTTNNPSGEIRGQVAPMIFMADLSGAAERPNPVETTGRGSAILMLVGNRLTFDLQYDGLKTNAHLAHIHGPSTVDAAAPVMVDLAPFNGGSFGSSGTLGGTATLNPDQIAALVDGLTYVNIHTPAPFHPGGEIRGQIWPRTVAVPLTAVLSGAAERPDPVDSPALGTGSFALEGHTLHFNVRYSGLKQVANNAHIHGPATAAQPAGVMVDLVPSHVGPFGTNGTFAGTVVLTDVQRAALLEGRTYVNIHSDAHRGGEIRGQIIPSVMHTVLLGASERPASVHISGRGRGTLLLAHDQLHVNATYADLTGPAIAAHIHGPAATSDAATVMNGLDTINGGGFGAAGSFSGAVQLNQEQMSALVDALTYLNVHTGNNAGGEIRGQIIR